MDKSESINELMKALSEARKNFKPIVRDKTVTVKTRSGGDYKFTYAPLENLIEATSPALADAGLSVMQFPGKDGLESILAHSSGQYISSVIPIMQIEGGPQAFGSAISYARRYALGALLNVAFTDDDDANIAEGNKAKRAANPIPGYTAKTVSQETFDNMTDDEKDFIRSVAKESLAVLNESGPAACIAHIHSLKLDADERVALNSFFDSKQRKSMKDVKEADEAGT